MQSENHVIYRCHKIIWKKLVETDFEDLDLILRNGFAGLDIWSILVVQSEHRVIYKCQGGPKMTWKKLT